VSKNHGWNNGRPKSKEPNVVGSSFLRGRDCEPHNPEDPLC
jgi:hypothetical protein